MVGMKHESHALAAHTVLTVGIVEMVANLLYRQIGVYGIILVVNLVDIGRRHVARNSLGPVLNQARRWLSVAQKERKARAVHGSVTAGSQNLLAHGRLGRRPVVKLELGLVVKGRFSSAGRRALKEHDDVQVTLLVLEAFLDKVRVELFAVPVIDFEGSFLQGEVKVSDVSKDGTFVELVRFCDNNKRRQRNSCLLFGIVDNVNVEIFITRALEFNQTQFAQIRRDPLVRMLRRRLRYVGELFQTILS